ncbi:g4546 [Coccomyxa elongata]
MVMQPPNGDVDAPETVLRKDPNEQPASLRAAAMCQDGQAAAGARSAGNLGAAALVREVLCACQAFDGRHVRYKGGAMKGGYKGGFEIAADAGIPPVQRSLMLKLCELGWLYRKTQSHAKEEKMSGGGSAIRQAFQAALQHELNSLYQLMAQLDALAGHPLPAGEDTGAPYLTLRRLAVWIGEPLQRLKTLASLADAVIDLTGGQLISALEAATKHGEPGVSGTVSAPDHDFTELLPFVLDFVLCALRGRP